MPLPFVSSVIAAETIGDNSNQSLALLIRHTHTQTHTETHTHANAQCCHAKDFDWAESNRLSLSDQSLRLDLLASAPTGILWGFLGILLIIRVIENNGSRKEGRRGRKKDRERERERERERQQIKNDNNNERDNAICSH